MKVVKKQVWYIYRTILHRDNSDYHNEKLDGSVRELTAN